MAGVKFCKNCGEPLSEDATFCENCQTPYEEPDSKEEQAAEAEEESSTQVEKKPTGGPSGDDPPKPGRKNPTAFLIALGAVLLAVITALVSLSGQSSYEVVIKDCTWDQAFEESIEAGGHLAMIETEKEYKKLVSLLQEADLDTVRLYISAARADDDDMYYWVDSKQYLVGDALNGEKSYARDLWKSGNPSKVNSQDTSVIENRVELQHTTSFQWALNDVANNILDADPDWSGKIGYIIEYG